MRRKLGIIVLLCVFACVRSDIFSTDVLYGSEVTSRSLYESYNSGSNTKILLLTDQSITSDGHLIGFKFYHHANVLDYSKVHIGIWRLVSGSNYQMMDGVEPLSWTAYDEAGATTSQAGVVKILYFTNSISVTSGDIIGMSISDSTSPIAYAEPGTSCTYKESIDASGTWPPATATFSDTSMNCREYSLQAVVDTTYTGIRYTYCQFYLAYTIDFFPYISNTVYDNNGNRVEYSNNLDMCWLVRGPLENEGIKFETTFFDVESNYDVLTISSYNESVYEEYKFSGSVGPDFSTASPRAKVTFITDSTVVQLGFEIVFGYGTFRTAASSDDDPDIGLIVGLTILGIVVLVVILVVICCCCKCCCFKKTKQVEITPSKSATKQGRPYPLQRRHTQKSTLTPLEPPYESGALPAPANYQEPLMMSSNKPGFTQPTSHMRAPGLDNGGSLPPLHPTTGYLAYLQRESTSSGTFQPRSSLRQSSTRYERFQVEEAGTTTTPALTDFINKLPPLNDSIYTTHQSPAPVLPPLVSEPSSGSAFNMADVVSATVRANIQDNLEPVDGPSGHGQADNEGVKKKLKKDKIKRKWKKLKIPGPAVYFPPY